MCKQLLQNTTWKQAFFSGVLGLPAKRFRHTRILHILVCGEAFDEHCDHLHRNVLDEAGQSNGWIKGGVWKGNVKKFNA